MTRRSINYGKWASMLNYGAFALPKRARGMSGASTPLFSQFSGGRTSGFMTCMAPDDAVITFENTGREHERTLEFVQEVGEALGREIVWLEFRPPAQRGARPREFRFARVDFKTAARKGEPFEELMESINAYRDACGNPPITPWARSRICTAYMKSRVLDRYVESLGYRDHDVLIGLRADEPDRVARLRKQESRHKGLPVPLYDAGVTKADVLEFWSRQSFDLGIAEHEGNCDGCFLKDYADVSRAIGARPEAVAWWSGMQAKWAMFGGKNFPSYAQLAAELPARLAIEAALKKGETPVNGSAVNGGGDVAQLEPKRFRLVLAQETRRYREGPAQFACACESAEDEEDEDAA